MRRINHLVTVILTLVFLALPCAAQGVAQVSEAIQLPQPVTTGGRPLMEVLKERKSTREFKPDALPMQVLSNLLWAAFGVNRADGRRTAPSAVNWQEIDIYVALETGAYRYDAKLNKLEPVVAKDVRSSTGGQPFVATAPLNLVYVADYSKVKIQDDEARARFTNADVGFIAENVYLFCASEGLGTVVRGLVDQGGLSQALNLRADQKVLLAQTVGYPK